MRPLLNESVTEIYDKLSHNKQNTQENFCLAQEFVKGFLRRFIKSINKEQLVRFLRFCTCGVSLMIFLSKNVSFEHFICNTVPAALDIHVQSDQICCTCSTCCLQCSTIHAQISSLHSSYVKPSNSLWWFRARWGIWGWGHLSCMGFVSNKALVNITALQVRMRDKIEFH